MIASELRKFTFFPAIFRKNILCKIHVAGCCLFIWNAVDGSRAKYTCVSTAHCLNATKRSQHRGISAVTPDRREVAASCEVRRQPCANDDICHFRYKSQSIFCGNLPNLQRGNYTNLFPKKGNYFVIFSLEYAKNSLSLFRFGVCKEKRNETIYVLNRIFPFATISSILSHVIVDATFPPPYNRNAQISRRSR